MKDKEKQIKIKRGELVDLLNQEQEELKNAMIEEMAIIDCNRVPKGTNCADCQFARVDCCNSYRMATKLYEQGYRKLPEDSVVLLIGENNQALDEKTIEYFIKHNKQIRKETAEKIFTFVNSFGTHNWERFTKFIKQFGVEIKE